MDINDKKKLLYKEKPIATLLHIGKGMINYQTVVNKEDGGTITILFSIPFNEVGDGIFANEMQSQYLIRWMI